MCQSVVAQTSVSQENFKELRDTFSALIAKTPYAHEGEFSLVWGGSRLEVNDCNCTKVDILGFKTVEKTHFQLMPLEEGGGMVEIVIYNDHYVATYFGPSKNGGVKVTSVNGGGFEFTDVHGGRIFKGTFHL